MLVEHADHPIRCTSRGTGKEFNLSCFVCIGEMTLRENLSFFVYSRQEGECAEALFGFGARLDYREFEPDWIQVKVGACDKHITNLDSLHQQLAEYKHITADIVKKARSISKKEE